MQDKFKEYTFLQSPQKTNMAKNNPATGNLNKPATSGLGHKNQGLGFEPFLEGSDWNFGKIEYREISLESNEPLRSNFEQTRDWGVCPNYITKMLKNAEFSHWWPQKLPMFIFQPKMTSDI